jgi:serine/threonine protein kinase/Flp pilus assembly protein TadD
MGSVYEARQDNPARTVALKVMRPEAISHDALNRFRTEIEVLGGLNHPGIAQIHEAGQFATEGGVQPYFAMEFVHGQPLLKYALRNKLEVAERLELMAKVCDAVHFAHLKGVIHRDLKPENILIVDLPEGRQPKILDFGVAKALRAGSTMTSAQTQTGQLLGTLPYMSPEQTEGQHEELDERSDIYQLGIMLYQLLAGRRPYKLSGLPIPRALRVIRMTQPQPLGHFEPQCRHEIEVVVARALEKDRRRRHPSALSLAEDLRRCAQTCVEAETWPRRCLRWVRHLARSRQRLSFRAVMVLAGVVLVLGVATWRFLQPPPLPQARNIAVLAFSTESADPNTGAFARGLSEALTSRLSVLTADHRFTVAHASFVKARGFPSPEDIGTQLAANLAVLGSLSRSGSDASVELSLTGENARRVLRREIVTARFDEPMTLEWEVLAAALRILELEVAAPERRELADYGTRSSSAYHLYLRGLGYLQDSGTDRDNDSTISLFQEALSLDPDFARARLGLARALWSGATDGASRENAIRECEEAIRSDANLAEAHMLLGTWLRRLERLDDARQQLERANFLEPTNDEAVRGLITVYWALDTEDRIEPLLRAQQSLRPHYWQAYRWLGNYHYRRSQFAEAIPELERWTQLAPRYYRAFNTLGAAYAETGRWDAAGKAFRRSLEIQPTGMAHSNLATAYFYQGFFRRAVDQYDKALIFMERTKTINFAIFGSLGDALFWAPGERERAAAHYRRAIEMARADLERTPDNVTTLGRVALYHAMLGERQLAFDHLSKALELAPDDARTCFRAARIHQRIGNTADAMSWLKKARALGTPAATVENHPAFRDLRADERFRALLRPVEVS